MLTTAVLRCTLYQHSSSECSPALPHFTTRCPYHPSSVQTHTKHLPNYLPDHCCCSNPIILQYFTTTQNVSQPLPEVLTSVFIFQLLYVYSFSLPRHLNRPTNYHLILLGYTLFCHHLTGSNLSQIATCIQNVAIAAASIRVLARIVWIIFQSIFWFSLICILIFWMTDCQHQCLQVSSAFHLIDWCMTICSIFWCSAFFPPWFPLVLNLYNQNHHQRPWFWFFP